MSESSAPVRTCNTCGIAKPATAEFFHRSHSGLFGIKPCCKVCVSQISRGIAREDINPDYPMRVVDRRECIQCGESYAIPPSVSQTGPQRKGYCSRDCYCDARYVPFNDPEKQRVQLFGKGAEARFALVSPEDYDRVMTKRWFCSTGYPHMTRYARGEENLLHRWLLDVPEGMWVDHIDGNPLNNQRSNLRLCSRAENNFNQAKRSSLTSSRYKGVCWNKRKQRWQAGIGYQRKGMQIGLFKDEEEAARAYDQKAAELFGEFARLNFPVG